MFNNGQVLLPLKHTVTVCGRCLRASCWQGEHMCQEAQGAGTVEMTVEELTALDLEHSQWWDICPPYDVARHVVPAANCRTCGERCGRAITTGRGA